MLWLDYRCEVRLLGYPPHLLVPNKLVPSDFKGCSQAPLIKSINLAVTAQYSDPYWKISRIQVLHNFSFVGLEMCDFQKWLSRLCITTRVIPLHCMMSGVLCVDEWMTTATCLPSTVMVGGTFTVVPKAWTFVFCQFTLNPSKGASLAIVSSTDMRSSSNSARTETLSAKSRSELRLLAKRHHSCLVQLCQHAAVVHTRLNFELWTLNSTCLDTADRVVIESSNQSDYLVRDTDSCQKWPECGSAKWVKAARRLTYTAKVGRPVLPSLCDIVQSNYVIACGVTRPAEGNCETE